MNETWKKFCKSLEESVDDCLETGTATEIEVEDALGRKVTVAVYKNREDLDGIPLDDGPFLIGGPIDV